MWLQKQQYNDWRNNKNYGSRKQRHKPGVNCERYKHTPATCWSLHPELKSKDKRFEKIYVLQRQLEEAQQEIANAEPHQH